MRVLVIANNFWPISKRPQGGADTSVIDMAKYLDHEVFVWCPSDSEYEGLSLIPFIDKNGDKICSYAKYLKDGKKPLRISSYASQLEWILDDYDIEFVINHASFAIPILKVLQTARCPSTTILHQIPWGIFLDTTSDQLKPLAEGLGKGTSVFAVSEFVKDTTDKRFQGSVNGTCYLAVSPYPVEASEPDGEIITVSRADPEKFVDVSIEAAARAKRKIQAIVNPPDYGPWIDYYRKTVDTYRDSPYVIMREFMDRTDLLSMISKKEYLVEASYNGALSLVAFDALRHGVPVLGSTFTPDRDGGVRELMNIVDRDLPSVSFYRKSREKRIQGFVELMGTDWTKDFDRQALARKTHQCFSVEKFNIRVNNVIRATGSKF